MGGMKTSPLLVALAGIMLGCRFFFRRHEGAKPPMRAIVLLSFLWVAIIGVGVWGLWGTFSD
jgi:hypothetical protein